jgi:hypothetical protein
MKDTEAFILFYSNKCEHCKEFIIKLKETNIDIFNKFNKICVDNNQNIPKAIESVPTIIVPSHQYPLTDNSVFLWLDTMLSNSNSNSSQNPELTQGNNDNTIKSTEDGTDISPYVACEMGNSFSDSFSFLDSSKPLEHNYTFLEGNISGNDINSQNYTTEDLERPKMESKNNSSGMESQYETFISSRDNDPNIDQAPQRR